VTSSIATDESFKDKNGDKEERVEDTRGKESSWTIFMMETPAVC
jgi:hypothetical protein